MYVDKDGSRSPVAGAVGDNCLYLAHRNGINLEGYGRRLADGPQTIGYLARMSREKGLGDLVEAYLLLQERGGFPQCRLRIAGSCPPGDEAFVEDQKRKIEEAGLSELVDWHPNVTREQKTEFLRGLTVFSVPMRYSEAFGLCLIEAMASGVPVVNPEGSAFEEIEIGRASCRERV